MIKPALALFILAPLPALADFPTIEAANVQPSDGGYSFAVTLKHPDTGWEHYADGWEVLAPDGTSLGMRVLAHPHVNEQPFTRSLGGIVIPEGTTEVTIRARDNVDGWTAETYTFALP